MTSQASKNAALDPARQALAAAHLRRDNAMTKAATARLASEDAGAARWPASDAVEAAEAALKQSLLGAIDVSPGDARRELEAAQNERDAAVANDAKAAKLAADAAGVDDAAEREVHERIKDVIAASPAVAKLVLAAEDAQKSLSAVTRIWRLLMGKRLLPEAMANSASWRDWPVDASFEQQWAKVLTELESDAYAKLPE